MGDVLAGRRKRLLFQSRRRGMRESDLLLGEFARRHIDGLSAPQLDRFEALLERSDPDLMAWISGAEPVPPDCDHDVMKLLKNIKISISRH